MAMDFACVDDCDDKELLSIHLDSDSSYGIDQNCVGGDDRQMITTGHSNYCAITTREELYCWGEENDLALDHPKNSRFVDISKSEEILYGCSLD